MRATNVIILPPDEGDRSMTTTTQRLSRFAGLVIALVLAACAAPGSQSDSMTLRQGVIEQISPTQIQTSQHTGVGAVLGGLAGVGVGSLIGGGTGRDVAMVVGAIGGTIGGAEVARRYDQPVAGQEIFVRTTSGVLVEVTQPATPGLRVGQRVYIEGKGDAARVIPQAQ
jgi:outer membrane lipoprotein SlyB